MVDTTQDTTTGPDAGEVTADQAAAAAAAAAASSDTRPGEKQPDGAEGSTPSTKAADDPFADLDKDTREWLGKREVKSPVEAAKLAYEQAKRLGSSITLPDADAGDDEWAGVFEKLGAPKDPSGYEFKVPESLPEGLPYQAERADSFKALAAKIHLLPAQAAAIHDWAAANAVDDFSSLTTNKAEQDAAIAKAETGKIEKLWGPLDGDTAKQNLALANRALMELGGQELVDDLKARGILGPNKEIFSMKVAEAFAKVGATVYMEGETLNARAATLGNPFAEGANFNVTEQSKLYRKDPEFALSLIAAAGKKPEDFGLKA